MSSFGRRAWGDDEEDDILPRRRVGPVDPATGIREVTDYKRKPSGELVKLLIREKVHTVRVRRSAAAEERRNWEKFGDVVGSKDESNITIQTQDVVNIEQPSHSAMNEEESNKQMAAGLTSFWEKQQMRKLNRIQGVEEDAPSAFGRGGLFRGIPGESGPDGAGGKYVPPSRRFGGGDGGPGSKPSYMQEDDKLTLRITNISELTEEDELRELCCSFGLVSRVYLAKDKATGENKGFAYVTFRTREDAARAHEGMQGIGMHHLILSVDYAKPRVQEGGGEQRVFRSGYGQKLAQDTTRTVSYASNLTR